MTSWIIVPNWERFQHYGLARRPTWIKNYTGLLRKDEYMDLPLAARGLLHGIWLAYAEREGRLRQSDLPSILLARARDAHLTSLNQAGLIEFCASKPLLLNLEESRARTREAQPAEPEHRRTAAENWIRNGAAALVPAGHLAEVLAEDFRITDPEIVGQLLTQAQEWRTP